MRSLCPSDSGLEAASISGYPENASGSFLYINRHVADSILTFPVYT